MFVILTGSSGVGKNTVIKELSKKNNNIVLMPTYTSREKREGEKYGSPYFYITKEAFQQKIKNGEFIEYEHIHNNFYGSSYEVFDKYISLGKILIKDVGVEGAQNLTIKLKDRTEIKKFFLTTKYKSELKKRLIGREEKQIKLRLKRYKYEQKQKNKFDFIIYNEDLNTTVKQILDLLKVKDEDYIPCKNLKYISEYKVKYYSNKLKSGKVLSPIKILINNGNVYIVSGLEKFIASVKTGLPVARLVVNKKIKPVDVPKNWLDGVQNN